MLKNKMARGFWPFFPKIRLSLTPLTGGKKTEIYKNHGPFPGFVLIRYTLAFSQSMTSFTFLLKSSHAKRKLIVPSVAR